MTKPENKYKHGSIIWSVMEGDWEDLTVPEIAEILNTSPQTVLRAIQKIKKDTRYEVRYSGSEPEEMTDDGTFPGRLRKLRKRNRLSRRQLGELCGLSKNVILLYESGTTKPSMGSLVALAEYFDTSIDYLLGRRGNPQRLL